ncbi:MAG: galactose-1-phosphate uridylyltransferase [Methanospirillum sp.]|nr:galactose-1-phosphate uridylyltransferase [Methanospirillum sp.]
MFHTNRYEHSRGFIEYRTELLTGIKSRICPERLKRGIGRPDIPDYPDEGCPFCPDLVLEATPAFPDGRRVQIGECITFPNLFPFSSYHIVSVISRDHVVRRFSARQIRDALSAQVQVLSEVPGYVSINWNYLPSAGASLPHPHLQGLADPVPDTLPQKYLDGSKQYYSQYGISWWGVLKNKETETSRRLKGTNLFWYAHFVPIGEKEIRCILPCTTVSDFKGHIPDFAEDLIRILDFFQDMGNNAWNMSVFFGTETDRAFFSAFATIIVRINPNSLCTSDTAFMEKLHFEPVILTLPEDLGKLWCNNR